MMSTLANRKSHETEVREIAKVQPEEPETKKRRWSTAFLMAGSALLGATAVAFWNRRAIANMRVQLLTEAANPRVEARIEEDI